MRRSPRTCAALRRRERVNLRVCCQRRSHAGLVLDLQDLLGASVEVGTEKSLHWFVRERILAEAVPL